MSRVKSEPTSEEPVAMVTNQQEQASKFILKVELEEQPDWSPSSSPAPDSNGPDTSDDESEKQPPRLRFQEHPEKQLLVYGDFTFQLPESSEEKKGQEVKCTLCDLMIPYNKGYIRRHVVQVHTDRFQCPHCPWKFPNAPRLRAHVQSVHEGQPKKRKIVECKICERPISTNELKQHEWSHKSNEEKEQALKDPSLAAEIPWSVLNKEKKVQCDKCEDRFSTYGNLKKHQKRKHKDTEERKELCPECGKGFLNLRVHMRLMHAKDDGVVDLMKTCLEPGCGRRFLNFGDLTRHKNQVHRKLKPFECADCGKCFGDKWNWKQHVKSHTIKVEVNLKVEEESESE